MTLSDLPSAQDAARIGVMICGHGSRDAGAVAEFAALAEKLKPRFPDWPVDHGYLEFARPVIRDGLDRLVAGGVRHVLAVPGMLFAAGHAKNDIPSVLNTYQAAHPGLSIEYGRELGLDPRMIRAAGARIQEALDGAVDGIALHETLLLVVGRGASDPDANSNVAKVTRMLWEGFGFGWAETAYSGVTFPLVEPALEKAAKLGFRRIIVFPYFLFTGVLVQRIYDATDIVAARHPEIAFLKAHYLNDHPLVLDTFVDRVHEILAGQNLMNCQMCKYREQILGFEAEIGLPQESHHHHVEGIMGAEAGINAPPPPLSGRDAVGAAKRRVRRDDPAPSPSPQGGGETQKPSVLRYQPAHSHDHEHGHDHPHDHSHDHHHHPYPHADHPLGPRSLKRD